MTLDCNGLQNGQSRVISFLSSYGSGRRPVFFFFRLCYKSREISGIEIRHSRLERNTDREANSLSE